MNHTLEERVIAFAALFQAVKLVQQVARRGSAEPAPFEASINSLLITDAKFTDDVFGGAQGVETGLRLLVQNFGAQQEKDVEITRYLIGLLHLERKLAKLPQMMAHIGESIERAKSQGQQFGATHANTLANLAGIYADTISALTPRIIVNGEHGNLAITENADKVRALLLAGIRAIILWRQCGGTRWQILWQRRKMLEAATRMLDRIHG